MRRFRYSLGALFLATTLVVYCVAFPSVAVIVGSLAAVALVLLALIGVQWPIWRLLNRWRDAAPNGDESLHAD